MLTPILEKYCHKPQKKSPQPVLPARGKPPRPAPLEEPERPQSEGTAKPQQRTG